MESVSPNIFVKNINRTIEFIQTSKDFQLLATVPEEGDYIFFAMMQCGNVTLYVQTLRQY